MHIVETIAQLRHVLTRRDATKSN